MGKPIKASTKFGFKLPPAAPFSPGECRFSLDGLPLFLASLAVGVGYRCAIWSFRLNGLCSLMLSLKRSGDCAPLSQCASGVRNKEDTFPPVFRSDTRSFIIKYPDIVAFTLQIGANCVCRDTEYSRYVFTDNPTRSKLSDQPRKFWPEVTGIVLPFFVSCHTERLS